MRGSPTTSRIRSQVQLKCPRWSRSPATRRNLTTIKELFLIKKNYECYITTLIQRRPHPLPCSLPHQHIGRHLTPGGSSIPELLYIFSIKEADVNARNINGATPLHYAVLANSPLMVELLLKFQVSLQFHTIDDRLTPTFKNTSTSDSKRPYIMQLKGIISKSHNCYSTMVPIQIYRISASIYYSYPSK